MNRHEATRRVMRTLWGTGIEHKALGYVAPDGSRPVVVCTPNEYLSEVLARVDALGGSANIVVAEVKSFRVLEVERVPGAITADSQGVNGDISMGMLLIRVGAQRRKGQRLMHVNGADVSLPLTPSREFEYA